MRKQQGFTLIELVVVIIILGILAVTAAPRFIDLQGEAKESALDGVAGSIRSVADMSYAQMAINNGLTLANQSFTTADGATVNVDFGYPEADADGIIAALSLGSVAVAAGGGTNPNFDWVYDDNGATIFISAGASSNDANLTDENCFVSYTAPTAAGESYQVAIDASGC